MVQRYKVLWKKGNTTRYLLNRKDNSVDEVQIGKYRELSKMDKVLKVKGTWHGKWYIDVFGRKVRLFNTSKQAKTYFLNYVLKNTSNSKKGDSVFKRK